MRQLICMGSLITAIASGQGGGEIPQAFDALLKGKDLAGWEGRPHLAPAKLAALSEEERQALDKKVAEATRRWTVDKGELVGEGATSDLTTTKDYGDVELQLEYCLVNQAEGNIGLRGTPAIHLGDPAKGSGGLAHNVGDGKTPLVVADKALGEWNQMRILQVGERTTVFVNHKFVVDHVRMANSWDKDLPLPRKGPIQLRVASGTIRFRNMSVREIPSTEANEFLRKHGAAGYGDVFNGKDFTGWAGPIDQYEVKDGAIVCLPKKGGTIYTKEQYGDFMARLEYKLPPGGNNGLAIRYPGKGDTAYVGMCEIQVLDDTAKQYAKLDPRQYNGSAYGMVPAHRGYLRPVGEWNFEEVTIVGPTIVVELNGTVILNCDLSKVTKYMANSPHPGKERTMGHFGFAGHNDPVAFRNIQIKTLDKK